MPKTKNAFALRGFDVTRILQRPFFRKFQFDTLKSDAEILGELFDTRNNSLDTLEKNLSVTHELTHYLSLYQSRIIRHCGRLKRLSKSASRHMKELENLFQDFISKPPPECESVLSRLSWRLNVKPKITEQKLAEIGKLDDYYKFWSLNDTAADNVVERYCVIEQIEQLLKFIDDSRTELITRIKKYNRKVFASRLKSARLAKKITQYELAQKIYMTQNSYSSYEIGRAEPPLTTLIRLARELNCTTDWLLGLTS